MKWEYRTVDLGKPKERKLDRELNALGSDGWELVATIPRAGNLMGGLTRAVAIFKRPAA